MSGRVDVDALAGPPEGYVVAAGDAHKVEPTRHHFAAIIAGLKTAQEYLLEVERERDALVGRVRELEAGAEAGERAREALTELANEQHWEVGAPYQTDGRYRFITPSWSPFSTPWAFARAALGEGS